MSKKITDHYFYTGELVNMQTFERTQITGMCKLSDELRHDMPLDHMLLDLETETHHFQLKTIALINTVISEIP